MVTLPRLTLALPTPQMVTGPTATTGRKILKKLTGVTPALIPPPTPKRLSPKNPLKSLTAGWSGKP
jgi:hypothetical protein